MCKVLNTTAIASGYAGRDPQGGTSDGSLFNKFSKVFELERRWKIDYVQEIELGDEDVGDLN